MKRGKSIGLFFAAFLWLASVMPLEAEGLFYKTAEADVPVYSQPSGFSPVLGVIEAGETFSVSRMIETDGLTLSESRTLYGLKDGFAITEYNGTAGYVPVMGLYLDADWPDYDAVEKKVFVNIQEGVPDETYDQMMHYYNMVPEWIRARFESKGFIIRLTNDIETEAYAPYGGYSGWQKIDGVFDYELKILYVSAECPSAVSHEMGHFVNDELSMFSSRNRSVYESESAKISTYAETNDREFFGEVFALYVTSPQTLLSVSPASYAYVEQALAEYAAM